MARPKAGTASQTTPQTEIDCQKLQEEFLKPDCPQSVKDDYFMLLRIYARSLALKEIKRKGIYLPPERVDEICTDATLLIMKQYTKPGWKIEASFAGMLRYKVIEAMYSKANEEKNSSLNVTFTEDQNSKEVIDLVSSQVALPWGTDLVSNFDESVIEDDFLSKFDVSYEVIEELVDDAYRMLPYPTFMRFLPWLLLQLRKPKIRNASNLFNKTFLTNKEINAFEILLLEMRNRIIEHASIILDYDYEDS